MALPWALFAGDEPVTPEQLQAVHALYLKAKEKNFDRASVVELYKSPNAASAATSRRPSRPPRYCPPK